MTNHKARIADRQANDLTQETRAQNLETEFTNHECVATELVDQNAWISHPTLQFLDSLISPCRWISKTNAESKQRILGVRFLTLCFEPWTPSALFVVVPISEQSCKSTCLRSAMYWRIICKTFNWILATGQAGHLNKSEGSFSLVQIQSTTNLATWPITQLIDSLILQLDPSRSSMQAHHTSKSSNHAAT